MPQLKSQDFAPLSDIGEVEQGKPYRKGMPQLKLKVQF